MVQNLLRSMYREVRGLHQAAYILALFTFGSQILALIRDRLLAHQFGAGIELDVYYTAFRIPDILYVIFASTLSVYVLIPFIARSTESESGETARNLLSQIFSLFLVVYTGIALLVMIFTPTVVTYLFPGFAGESATLTVLIRILLLQPLFLGVSSLLGVITQIERRFVLYAISPLIYNVGIILGLIFLYPIFGISGIAIGVIIGAFGHVLIQIPLIVRSELRPRFTLTFRRADIVTICKTSFTRAVTLSLHQLVLLGFVGFASLMTIGSVSVFQFAYNLQSVPLAIIGVSYSVAAFPLLAQLYAEKKFDLMSSSIITTARHIIFWSFPAMALFIVIRAQFVRVVLGSGAFDWNDTRLTAGILALFMLSLVAQAMHLVLVRALYAVGNTRLPFFVTLFSSSLALSLALLFYVLIVGNPHVSTFFAEVMRLEGVAGIEVLALPLGYSCALLIHSVVLLVLSTKHLYIKPLVLVLPILRSLVASFFGGYVAYAFLNYYAITREADTLFTVFAQGFIAGIGGLAGVILVHYAVKSEELFDIYRTLKRRFKREQVIIPQDEDNLAV